MRRGESASFFDCFDRLTLFCLYSAGALFSILSSGSHFISPCEPQQPNLKSELSLQTSIFSVPLEDRSPTILYCIVGDRSSRSSVGVTFSLFSSIIRTWAAASAGHRLAQGWVHTTGTEVAGSFAFWGVTSD